MKCEYIICDRCAASMPEATGALVLRYGGHPQMHLCEKCVEEVFKKRDETVRKLKGESEGAE